MPTINAIGIELSGSTGTGTIVGDTNPVITTPRIATIAGANANNTLDLVDNASGVNYLQVQNSIAGSPVIVGAAGADSNIGFNFVAKNAGRFTFTTQTTSSVFTIIAGAGGHITNFSFPNTFVTRLITVPDATGTLTLLGNTKTGTGNVVLDSSPIITTPRIAQINDSNNIASLTLPAAASAVNNVQLTNSATGSPVGVAAIGSDTDIVLNLSAKGAAAVKFLSTADAAIQIASGTANQHTTALSFANTAASRTVTFPDTDGTLQLQSQALITAPANSASSALTIGVDFQNTTGSDIVLTVYLAVSAATSANILVGVGSASSPTQQTVVSGLTVAALSIIPIPIYIPNNYYALVSTSGTITQTISGQMAMPV